MEKELLKSRVLAFPHLYTVEQITKIAAGNEGWERKALINKINFKGISLKESIDCVPR